MCRRSFKQAQVQSRIARARWQSRPFVYPRGREFIITTSRRRAEEEGRRGNYLSETQDVRSPARVPPILQCVRHPAWNSSVRLWSAVFRIKKRNTSTLPMQSDNRISSLIFLCKETRYPRNARLVAFYRASLSCLVSFFIPLR